MAEAIYELAEEFKDRNKGGIRKHDYKRLKEATSRLESQWVFGKVSKENILARMN